MKHARRLRQLLRADLHALLDRAADPARLLAQLAREGDEALAELDRTLRELDEGLQELERVIARWDRRCAAHQADAEAALRAGDGVGARRHVERRMACQEERDRLEGQLDEVRFRRDRLAIDRQRLVAQRAKLRDQRRERQRQDRAARLARRYETGADAALRRGHERVERIESRLERLEARVAVWDLDTEPPAAARPRASPRGAPSVDAALAELRARIAAKEP